MVIDSHHHLWRYDASEYPWIGPGMEVLKRDFGGTDLESISDSDGVDGFVTVQARQSIAETEALIELAQGSARIKGVVGWVDFASDAVVEQLDQFSGVAELKGMRHVVQDEPADDFILGADFNRGIRRLVGRGLVYDLLIFARQLPATIQFAQTHGDIPMVLDHIAKPTITSDQPDPAWVEGIQQLAQCEHVSCKFSGVATEVRLQDWDIDLIRPYWQVVLDAFTPERLMFGSDWPVCLLRTEYTRWKQVVEQLASTLSQRDQEAFFGGNASRVYQLEQ